MATKFDFKKHSNIDFDALLKEAREKRLALNAEMQKNAYDVKSASHLKALRDEYGAWIKENITDRGISCAVDMYTGIPKSLSITVAVAE